MHDRATGALDGTFLFLIRFEEHKDSAEVVGLLKQYLARHRWAFKQNTAFKKLSNKKVERATFQVLGPLSRREETKDGMCRTNGVAILRKPFVRQLTRDASLLHRTSP
jgi:hypothetical protein